MAVIESSPPEASKLLLRRFLLQIGALLAFAGGCAFLIEQDADRSLLDEAALTRARAHFHDIVLTRKWNAGYGGVYVEKKDGVVSSPHFAESDITGTNGKTYTLRNPAMMTREISELAAREGGYRSHITSLTPIDAGNAAEEWERPALLAFMQGKKESYGTLTVDGRTEFRYMAPLLMEAACLTCHQGYRVGEVGGGISVRFDITPLLANQNKHYWRAALAVFLGLAALFAIARAFASTLARRLQRLSHEQETVLQNALVGIVHLKHRRVISCNRRFEDIFGYGPGELVGQSVETLYASHEIFVNIGARAYPILGQGLSHSDEVLLRRRDGTIFSGAINGRAIDPAHVQEGSIWVYADISERCLAEAQLHKLQRAVEQSPVSTVITACDGTIEYVNPRFTRVTGYSAHEVIGQNPRILQSGETPAATYEEMWKTVLDGREWRGVLRNRRKNGELFWEEASISPIIDEHGKITHLLAVKEDISERKRIEGELEEYQQHLEQLVKQRTSDLASALAAARVADQTKDAFLANVSHELRTPLNAVIGLSGLALRASENPKQRDTLEKISESGQTLLAIINDLLDLTKIAAGEMQFEQIAFSPRKIAARVSSAMAHRAAEKGLALTQTLAVDLPEVLRGDPLRIEQILLNLVSNAIKFTQSGRVAINMACDIDVDDNICLRIEVDDTGIGMTQPEIERIFQPFAQADASITRRFGGTGLGLAICLRLAEGMKGGIEVSSTPHLGTTFTVRLQVGQGSIADLPTAEERPAFDPAQARYPQARVLVVDDQQLNREVVFELLASVGIVPRLADNGSAALDIVREAGPDGFDLVLMDIQMPVMDGITATRLIRELPGQESLPIAAMTAHTMTHEKATYLAAGMSDHIGKPFSALVFFRLLARWLAPAPADIGVAQAPLAPDAALALAAIPGLDAAGALERFAGNSERYRHWLLAFIGDAAGFCASVEARLASGESDAARKAVHAFKGQVGMLGMTELQRLASMLEKAIALDAASAAPAARLAPQVEAMRAALQAAFGGLPQAAPAFAAPPCPDGPLPAPVASVIAALDAGDGNCAAAIMECLDKLRATAWAPLLEAALKHVQRFDFDAARALFPSPAAPLDAVR
jgi:PAS domain S-box-containing protein